VGGIRIGIDIGGTFTDLQILDEASGALMSLKTPTTSEDPSIGLIAGLEAAAARFGFKLGDIRFLLHGTTIATNAVLERRLPRGVLVTTRGFEDVLEIGRHARRDVYALRPRREAALIARDRRIGVEERIRADGSVERALEEPAITRLIARLEALGAETVAVALLNAFVNADHEKTLCARILAAHPRLPVSLSSEISPEIREYERSSTTVLNALLVPVVRTYLENLAARLEAKGIDGHLLLVQSNGGVCSVEVAKREPVRLLLSGPSGGALAAVNAAHALARPNLVGIDMGGTSFDVSVVAEGKLTRVTQGEIDALPVRLPMIEIRTIGAGGGSIAAVDAGGRLTVGPRSAGARPGPVCYGQGGEAPTVTDANLALGRLDPDRFLGGAIRLDTKGARAAIDARVARPLGLDTDRAAEGILAVTNVNLAAAIRLSLFEKGLDPRDFSLLSFGGAGGLHAIAVAEELGIGEVIFPPDASTFSANGILHSDVTHDLARSRVLAASDANLAALVRAAAELRREGAALLEADGISRDAWRLSLSADMRYRGQAFELVVPWGDVTPTQETLARLQADFHALHRQRFSYANPEDPVEIVTLRLSAVGRLPSPPDVRMAARSHDHPTTARRVFVDGGWREIVIHRRDALGTTVFGPALIEEDYTIVLVASGWRLSLGAGGNLIARHEGECSGGER
jgi:N-methylhydantoinase A